MRVSTLFCVRARWCRPISTLGQRINEHIRLDGGLRDALPTMDLIEQTRFPCAHCNSEVLHVAYVWCCASCGSQRCPKCQNAASKCCSQCGQPKTVLSQTTVDKTKLGIQMWRVPVSSVPQIMYIRITAHAVGVGAAETFRLGNQEKDDAKSIAHYDYAIKSLNWIRGFVPEYFHSAGYDADLVRAFVCRLYREGKCEEATKLAFEVFPEVFCNQTVIGGLEDRMQAATKSLRNVTAKSGRAKLSLLFPDWRSIETSVPDADKWEKPENTVMDVVGDDAILFQKCGGTKRGRERWIKKSNSMTLADFRFVFDSEWGAANYLSYRYDHLSDGIPNAGLEQTLLVGTDCVLYGGVTPSRDGARTRVASNYVFREQNVVCKLVMTHVLETNDKKRVTDAAHGLKVAAHSHAAVIQMLLQDHDVTAAKSPKSSWLSSWWN